MSDPQGRILDLLRESHGVRAVVEVDADVICPRCAQGRGCGAGLFSRASNARRVEAMIPPGLVVETGDVVRISLAPEHILRAAVMVYGLPLGGAAVAAVVAYQLGLGDAGAAALALAGLGTGIWIGRSRSRQSSQAA
jgi:sigma-E factor negative regulatory protein RseC